MMALLSGFRNTDDIFEVEKIVDCEMRIGRWLYRVRWKGCPREEDTWEPEENLLTCDDLLKTFKEEHERRRRKRKLKRRERRNEINKNTPLHINVKEELVEIDSGSDDNMTVEKKDKSSRSSSAKVSPVSDLDDFDLSGLTRQQRHQIEKVLEQSKKDASLTSPTSSTHTDSEQNKQSSSLKVNSDTSSSELKGKERERLHKRKKIGKQPVIDESSDTDGSIDDPKDKAFSSRLLKADIIDKHMKTRKKRKYSDSEPLSKLRRSVIEIEDDDDDEDDDDGEECSKDKDDDVHNEDISKNKGKKPSEILGTLFGTPKKNTNSSMNSSIVNSPENSIGITSPGKNTITNSPVNSFGITSPGKNIITNSPVNSIGINSPGRNIMTNSPMKSIILNSPMSSVNLLSASDDSNDERSQQNCNESIRQYVPLLDQLQQKTEHINMNLASSMSMLQTSIALSTPDSFSGDNKLSPRKNPLPPFNNYYNSNTLGDNSNLNSISDPRDHCDNREPRDPRVTEDNTEKDSKNQNHPTQSKSFPTTSTLKLDIGKNRRTYMKNVENIRNTIAMKKLLMNAKGTDSDKTKNENNVENVNPCTDVTNVTESKIFNSSNNNKHAKVDEPDKPVREKLKLSEKLKRSISDPGNLKTTRQVISSISISGEKSAVGKDRTNSNLDTQHNGVNKGITNIKPSTISNSNESNVFKNVPPKRIMLPKSSPTVPNVLKISRSEKLLNAMKNYAHAPKKGEKAKKLSLKEYQAKKGPKQNSASKETAKAAMFIEFTKLPPIQSVSNSSSTQQKVVNNSADKVTVHVPKSPLDRRISTDKKEKEKGPKPNQIATNTDVLGNILESIKKPSDGRESHKGIDNEDSNDGFTEPAHMDMIESEFDTDLDEYSGDEDGLLRTSMDPSSSNKQSHLTLPHANSKTMDHLAIYQAMLRGDIDTLIRCDIPGNKIDAYVDEADTLLMKAVMLYSQQMAQILLEKKADPNKPSKHGPWNGKTPLMVAVEMNEKSMVSLLIQNDARMNTQTPNGETALIMASKLGHMEIIHVLLCYGADVEPASKYLEKKMSTVPQNLRPELQSTLMHHSEKLKEITEKVLKDLLQSRNTQLGVPLMSCRCVSPEEMDEHEFYFKCNVNGVEPHINVLMLALPVEFKRNGSVDVKFSICDNGIENVFLNDGQMFPTSPGCSFLYFLFPKLGEVNILRIKNSKKSKYKILLCIYSMTYIERTLNVNRSALIQSTSTPVPVH